MPYVTPLTEEIISRNIANIEQHLNEKSPPADRSFNRAWAAVEGMSASGLYSFARDAARENLAISASYDGLITIGEEYDVPRRASTAFRGKITLSLPHGQSLYSGTVYIGPQGLQYETTAAAIGEDDGTAEVKIQCLDTGPAGNLAVGDTLTIQSVVDGVGREAVVSAVTYLGLDIENIEDYRIRVLDAIRGGSGGGGVSAEEGAVDVQVDACVTSSDYRIACEAVGGVARAYPFSGPPENSGLTPSPGQRTVYIECTPDIDADGIPPQSLLDMVRAAIIADPVTEKSREILGVPTGPELLFVEPVRRTGIYVNVIGISVISGSLAAAEAAIMQAVTLLLKTFTPFVQGLDADFDRRDELAASILAQEVQNVLDAFAGSAAHITFGDSPTANLARYALSHDEKLKLAQINFEEAS
jgi:uncharacterized phage protein gp47/JayE